MMTEYYEDIALHQRRRLGPHLLTGKEIRDFAGSWDPLPLHTDPGYAETSGQGVVIASGFHLLAICQKLMIEQNPMAIVIGLGLDEVRFLAPGRPGDRLTVEIEAISKRESRSRPEAGIVTHYLRLFNQDEEVVLSYKGTGMIEKRDR
ncbi:MAG: hypothetical protein LC633_00890 [Desulfobulbaceae bacterium]|nr:hypothetical protein [Desulfobulbaceae bacterium]